jgi:hypothetical protein
MPRSEFDTLKANQHLTRKGLSTLDDPGELLQQLGTCVQDHDHFRSLLARVDDPRERRSMYESLKPWLRFPAKALDVYIAEAGKIAERKQLPTVDEAGNLHQFLPPQFGAAIAEAVTDQVAAKQVEYVLTLVCRSCTKTEELTARSQHACIEAARHLGWVHYQRGDGTSVTICPDCPAIRTITGADHWRG